MMNRLNQSWKVSDNVKQPQMIQRHFKENFQHWLKLWKYITKKNITNKKNESNREPLNTHEGKPVN